MSERILVDPITGTEYVVTLPEIASTGGLLGGLLTLSVFTLFAAVIVVKFVLYEPLAMIARLAAEGYKELSEGHVRAAAKKLILPGFVVLIFASVYTVLGIIVLFFVILWLVVVV